jgi:hypothetical protein
LRDSHDAQSIAAMEAGITNHVWTIDELLRLA